MQANTATNGGSKRWFARQLYGRKAKRKRASVLERRRHFVICSSLRDFHGVVAPSGLRVDAVPLVCGPVVRPHRRDGLFVRILGAACHSDFGGGRPRVTITSRLQGNRWGKWRLMPCPLGPSKGRDDDDCCWNIARKLKVDLCGERLSTDKHGLSHRDTAEQHHGHGLVIAADDHPGAMEERHAVTRQFHETRVPAPQGRGTTANSGVGISSNR